jgi:hypothetical protein
MHWRPTHEDRAAWSTVGGVLSSAAVVVGVASVWWPVVAALASIGVFFMLAPLLRLGPWRQGESQALPPAGVRAGHAIRAGGDINATGPIQAGRNIEAGGNIRSSTRTDSLLAAIAQRTTALAALGHVNPLVGRFRIEQFAAPLKHDEHGCVFRVVIAPDCGSAASELQTDTKDALKDALARSSLEIWGSSRGGENEAAASTGWLRTDPNSGQIVTFKRHWGSSLGGGFMLWGKATLQLPPAFQFGSRVVLVLDVVESTTGTNNQYSRLRLSLVQLHAFLHTLATTAIDEIGRAVFPLVCEETTPTILGPNYQINFGDRSLEACVEIPESFERPQGAQNIPWAEINTPEDRDSRDLVVRDTVIREGIQKTLRNNGYDRIEDEIAELPIPT